MTQTLPHLAESRDRARLLAEQPDAIAAMLPHPADESWRKVDISAPARKALSASGHATTKSVVHFHTGQSSRADSAQPASEEAEALFAELAFTGEQPRPQTADESRESMQAFLRPDAFTVLNLARSVPVSLSIGPAEAVGGVDSEQVVEIQHTSSSDGCAYPASIIEVQPGTNVTIIEKYSRATDASPSMNREGEASLHAGHTLLVVREGAQVRFLQIREHGSGELPVHHTRFLLHRDASLHASVLHQGGSNGKSFFQASLLEPGAVFRGTGIYTGKENETHHMEMGVQHLANHSQSSLLYKTVLSDRAHSVFLGNLEVPAGIRKVESDQLNHNLILSNGARAESRPWLVIRAEDVSCEHGATVGDLDMDALFFLKSRGLPETEARRLLIQGFFEQVIGEWPLDDERKDAIRTSLMQTIR